jgi:SulP family sulfate permease
VNDVESQGGSTPQSSNPFIKGMSRIAKSIRILSNPKSWDRRALWKEGVVYPISLLPAVLLGLLLNILDALSYGMILFPLGEPLFAALGADGISMFYVSTIISQVVFSSGGSIFKGGIGSEMIEVVPFFHSMAFTIMNRIGEDNPQSVLATTILAFSVSSVLTGLVFFLMGISGLGSLIGFFPRHILIGCIGGVGYFLLQTGLEVSARLPGSLEYNLQTLQKLFHLDTFPLWMIPLFLALGLLVLKRFVRSNFLVGAYFIAVAAVFYIAIVSARVSMDALRQNGWVFDAPSSDNPWYHFYTLYGEFHSSSKTRILLISNQISLRSIGLPLQIPSQQCLP